MKVKYFFAFSFIFNTGSPYLLWFPLLSLPFIFILLKWNDIHLSFPPNKINFKWHNFKFQKEVSFHFVAYSFSYFLISYPHRWIIIAKIILSALKLDVEITNKLNTTASNGIHDYYVISTTKTTSQHLD